MNSFRRMAPASRRPRKQNGQRVAPFPLNAGLADTISLTGSTVGQPKGRRPAVHRDEGSGASWAIENKQCLGLRAGTSTAGVQCVDSRAIRRPVAPRKKYSEPRQEVSARCTAASWRPALRPGFPTAINLLAQLPISLRFRVRVLSASSSLFLVKRFNLPCAARSIYVACFLSWIGPCLCPLDAEEAFVATGSLQQPRKEHTANLLPASRVLVAGGRNAAGAMASTELYDDATGEWTTQGSMHEARVGHRSVLLKTGKVLVVGGVDRSGQPLASAEVFDPTTGVWKRTGAMATARHEHSATLLDDGRVVVVGGSAMASSSVALKSCEVYNPASGVWSALSSMPTAWRQHLAIFYKPYDQYIVVVGGRNEGGFNTMMELINLTQSSWNPFPLGGPPDNLERLLPAVTHLQGLQVLISGGTQNGIPLASTAVFSSDSNRWQNGAVMPVARSRHAMVLLPDGRVLVSGGVGVSGSVLAPSALRSVSGAWTQAAALHTARSDHTATTLPDGKVLIAGGADDSQLLASCELFAPRAPEWAEGPAFSAGRSGHSLTRLPDGSLLAAGGGDRYGAPLTAPAERLLPSGSWENAGTFTRRNGHTATLLADGRVLAVGGRADSSSSSPSLARVELYDPDTNQWASLDDLPQPRFGHVAVLLLDGRVLVAGGHRTYEEGLETAHLYNPSTGSWTPTGSMLKARWAPSASLLPDGRVLLMGRGLHDVEASAEIYDPASGSWSATGPMTSLRDSGKCVTLVDGRVLAVCGPGAAAQSKAEIYDPVLNQWTAVPKPPTSRFLSSLTVLIDGRVVVAGESDVPDLTFATTEIYDPVANLWFTTRSLFFSGASPGLRTDGRLVFTGGYRTLDWAAKKSLIYDPFFEQRVRGRPVLQSAQYDSMGRLVLTGSGFGANPVVRWRRLEGGWSRDLAADSTILPTDAGFTTERLDNLPVGHATVTVLADGVPSDSIIVSRPSPRLVVNWPGLWSLHQPHVYFDATAPGEERETTITLRNSGNAVLTGLAAILTGEHASEFSFRSPTLPMSLPAGESVTLAIACLPQSPGFRTAQLLLSSNDPHTPLRTLELLGSGSADASLPALSAIADQSIGQGGMAGPLAFTLSGIDSPELYTFGATSSNSELVDGTGLTIDASGPERTLTVTPRASASGTALITLRATSVSEGLQTSVTFQLTVLSTNAPPTLAAIPDPPTLREGDVDVAIPFAGASPGGHDNQPLVVTAASSNPGLLGNLVVNYAQGAASGSVRFVPLPGQSGVTDLTVTVSDGESTTSQTFRVRVLPQIQTLSASVAEGNSGQTQLPFRVYVGSPQPEPVQFSYSTTAASAEGGSDFEAVSGMASIPVGATEVFIQVNVTGDAVYELDETFTLTLSEPVGGFFSGPATVTGTLLNDDAQPRLSVRPGNVTEAEPVSTAEPAPFLLWVAATLPAPSAFPLSWNLTTREGTAQAGSDFIPLGPATLTFAPGEISKWIAVGITGSQPGGGEPDEVFYLDFTPTTGPTAISTSTCTIRQLAVHDFIPLNSGLYALRFPTGIGQTYLIEESSLHSEEWMPSSSVLTGSGSVVTEVVFSTNPAAFFRVVSTPSSPGAADVGP